MMARDERSTDEEPESDGPRRLVRRSPGLVVFTVALFVRSLAAVVTTYTEVNPDSQSDATQFAATAEIIAEGFSNGVWLSPGPTSTYDLWGSFLAPFWLLPGPSGLYGRLGNAFLGAFAIYNIYLIARHYHSPRAGVFAAAPILFYPSFVAVHSTLLREAIVLAGMTTAVRVVMVRRDNSLIVAVGIVTLSMYVAYIQRSVNAVIFLTTGFIWAIIYAIDHDYVSNRIIPVGLVGVVLSMPVFWPSVSKGLAYLAWIRRVRASGRTMYLTDVVPETIGDLVAFSWIGAAYFLYAPFPWMIETIPDLLVGIEGLVSIGFTVAAVFGFRYLYHRNRSATVALTVGLAAAAVFYGVGTVNYGTGMRHRQMFLWVVFLFGGIGIAERVRVEQVALGHRSEVSDSDVSG